MEFGFMFVKMPDET
uniref:Uncharacterized protein n=1 Tax=Anguilla anguilla TaxID=7936 RepID=A0A0E9U490_ANGAN